MRAYVDSLRMLPLKTFDICFFLTTAGRLLVFNFGMFSTWHTARSEDTLSPAGEERMLPKAASVGTSHRANCVLAVVPLMFQCYVLPLLSPLLEQSDTACPKGSVWTRGAVSEHAMPIENRKTAY